jgi:hypothetical protein
MRSSLAAASCLACLAALSALERDARAFCRTSTCPLPPEFAPQPGMCQPADFAQYCASLQPHVTPLPIWWRNACVSYDIQQNASRQVSYAQAAQSFATAFGKWTGTHCTGGAGGTGRVSISVKDLGPVSCDLVQYSSDQGNQHVILFHDDKWPYPSDLNNTLGLTTITFDPTTGEIYDADMELNATKPLTVTGTVPPDGYDFLSIITHETGHFLGLAHSGDDLATMYAHYIPGTTTMRNLTSDDTAGICSIYLPNGSREVDPSVASSGMITQDPCDPTPRHGFQSDCAHPVTQSSCAAAGVSAAARPARAGFAAALFVGTAAARRRKRRPADSAGSRQ